jgi:hypothetical protein
VNLSVQYTIQQNQNAQLYIKLIEETSKLVSDNPNMIHSLQVSGYDNTIVKVLDGVRASNLNITGISVYGENGLIYMSNNVSNIPSYSQLKSDGILRRQIPYGQSSYWLARYKNISEFYTTYPYPDRKYGIFTYVSKIFDKDKNMLGYLLVDTNMISLYNFFNPENNALFKHSSTYIITDSNDILSAPFSTALNRFVINDIKKNRNMKKDYLISSNKQEILVFSKIPNYSDTIITVISLDTIYRQTHLLLAVMLALTALFAALSVLVSSILSKSISQPLIGLYIKMKK